MDEYQNDHWSDARNSVLEAVQEGICEAKDIIAEHPNLNGQHVSVLLGRLVKSGHIRRVRRGLYEPVREERS